jgi:hypothetical protein
MEGRDLSCLFAKHLPVREGKIVIAQGDKVTAADRAFPQRDTPIAASGHRSQAARYPAVKRQSPS